MPGKSLSQVAYIAAATVVTTAAVVTLATLGPLQKVLSGEDEERPPIIVRGGSVIFESGEGAKKGKKWKKVNDDWQPDHGNGIPVNKFRVAIQGSDAECPPLQLTRELSITYTDEQGVSSIFFITTKARNGNGSPAPTIVTDQKLDDLGNSGDYPKLTYGTDKNGSITHVKFSGIGGQFDCHGTITSVKLSQEK